MLCTISFLVLSCAVSFAGSAWTSRGCLVSEWSEWTSIDDGKSSRNRVILRYPTGGGTPCPILTESRDDCIMSEWSEWTEPHDGQSFRYRTIIQQLTPNAHCPSLVDKLNIGTLRNETLPQMSNRFTSSFMGHPRSNGQTGAQVGKCRDLLIILDNSGSVGQQQFDLTKEQIGKLLALLCPLPNPFDNTKPCYQQVAVLTFSNEVDEIFDFDAYRNVNAIKHGINNARFIGGSTCTATAFEYGVTMFQSNKGARMGQTGVVQEVLIITDGKSNCGGDARSAAKRLHASIGASVYALMVGDFDDNGIKEVADYVSFPTEDHLFRLAGYVHIQTFTDTVEKKLSEMDIRCAPFDTKR